MALTPDYDGCNHHLSPEAAIRAPQVLRRFGNAPFSVTEKLVKGVSAELLEQGYLMFGPNDHTNRGTYKHTGKLVIGNPPKIKRKVV